MFGSVFPDVCVANPHVLPAMLFSKPLKKRQMISTQIRGDSKILRAPENVELHDYDLSRFWQNWLRRHLWMGGPESWFVA
jgi:hypothetical protein